MDEAVRSNALEAQVYRDLLNSTDPNIRTMAGVGMLQAGQPRRGKAGLQGWLGEVQGNPIYPVLSKYMTTPQVTGYEDVPQVTRPEQAGYLPTSPPGVAPAAQPSTETTTPGAPGPTPVSPRPQTPRWFAADLTTGQEANEPQLPPGSVSTHAEPELESILKTRSVPPAPDLETVGRAMPPESLVTQDRRAIWGLPQAFPTAEQTAVASARGKAMGDIQGEVDQYTWMFKQGDPTLTDQQARAKAAQVVVQQHQRGGNLATTYVKGGLIPDPASPTGWSREWALRSDPNVVVYRPDQPANTPEYMAAKAAAVRQARYGMTPAEALSAAQRSLPNAPVELQMQLGDELMAITRRMAPTPGTAPTPTPETAPSAAPTPGTAVTPTATPTPGTAPPAPPAKLQDVKVSPVLSKRTGQPLPPAVQHLVSNARSTNDLIDAALTALEPYKNLNTAKDSLELAKKYRQGVYDPVSSAAAQLADLAGLQASSTAALTGGASRAYQYFVQRRQHVPRLPSSREVELYSFGMPAGMVGSGSRLLSAEGGFDSPKLMYDKLQQVKANNLQFIDEAMKVDIPPANQPPGQVGAGEMRVIGPNGETGTVPAGTVLPPGWRQQ
jgi:hypothetical protein